MIPGWTLALQMMRAGDEWELTIPSGLAYGKSGTPDGTIPPDQTLVFDVELLKVAPSQMGQCPAIGAIPAGAFGGFGRDRASRAWRGK